MRISREGIRSIVALLDNNDTMAKLRTARSREEVVALL
ncbi:PTS system ascorbate-specific transporter subunit IIA [Klebsiella variicola]|uniref:PTS system ascorbate-specific transporter subunit IIA n=1 Tax=Klebsiella variicola TaxID=244366 RepID=A0A7H4MAI7_KLEVA|nr:PTS system ascorbate-specific transporter subunit IIA [Klebsiella variicola]